MNSPLEKRLRNIIHDGLKSRLKWIKAMSRPGVNFTKEQQKTLKELVEADKLVEAQNIILDELKRQL